MFTDPKHPYSQALINSLPNLEKRGVFQRHPRPRAVAAAPADRLRLPSALPAWPGRTAAHRAAGAGHPARRTHRSPATSTARRAIAMTNLLELRKVSKVYQRGLMSTHATVALKEFSLTLKRRRSHDPRGRRRIRLGQDDAGDAAARLHHHDDRRDPLSRPEHPLARGQGPHRLSPRGAGGVPGSVRGVQPVLHGRSPAHRADQAPSSSRSRRPTRATRWTRR